ncbi:MAG TPA: hypothetical protein V6D50_27295 [Chroococcales cyanobacterium]
MNTKELKNIYQKYCILNQLAEESQIPLSLILSLTNLLQENQCDFSRPETEEYLSLLRLFAQEMLYLTNTAIANTEALNRQEYTNQEIEE